MARRLTALTVLALLASGCQAAVITAPGYEDAVDGTAGEPEAIFVMEVQPLLEARCSTCHEDEESAPVFLDPADYYTSVLAYPDLVQTSAPSSSALLSKGNHDGPAWTGAQRDTIEAWIEAEAEDGRSDPGTGAPETSARIVVRDGALNRIPLDSLGLPGSSLQFRAARVALGMHLTDVAVTAGTGGLALSHPRFVMYDARGTATYDDDRFASTELRVSQGMTAELASAVLLVDFPEGGEVAIEFDSAGTMN